MSGGSSDSALVILMFVRYSRCEARLNRSSSRASAPNALTMRCPVNASAVTCDRCSSCSWLRRVVLRTRLPNRTSGYTTSGAPVTRRAPAARQVEQVRREPDDRQSLAHQIADGLGDRLLDLVDVVRDPRHQLAGRVAAEERRRLIEDVAEQAGRAGRERPAGRCRS